jgi:hypothetical protein
VNGGSGSFSVTKPTGVASGDVIIAWGASNEAAWSTVPSGFTQFIVSADASTTNIFRVYGWYKVCGGSEPSSYSFESTDAGTNGAPIVVVMAAYRGVDTNNPVSHTSVDYDGALSSGSDGAPSTTFSQTAQGLLFFMRASRSSTGMPTFSTATANWAEVGDDGRASGSGSIRYAVGYYDHDTETGSGTRTEPSVTTSTDTTDSYYVLGCLRSSTEGPITATLPSVTSTFAGTHSNDATMAATLPKVSTSMEGIAAPPEGTISASLPAVTASLAGSGIGGSAAATLPSVSSAWAGAVEPIGTFECTLPFLSSVQFVGETIPFGEHVIRVEIDDRAFLVTDEDDGLIPILRSNVTEG